MRAEFCFASRTKLTSKQNKSKTQIKTVFSHHCPIFCMSPQNASSIKLWRLPLRDGCPWSHETWLADTPYPLIQLIPWIISPSHPLPPPWHSMCTSVHNPPNQKLPFLFHNYSVIYNCNSKHSVNLSLCLEIIVYLFYFVLCAFSEPLLFFTF